MGKRKKRLLFDVLDDVSAENTREVGPPRPSGRKARSRKTPSGSRKKKTTPVGPPEIRITRDMGVTIVVVVLAFVCCAYYSGLVHGRGAGEGPEDVNLSRATQDDGVDRSQLDEHYAIRACMENYNRYTVGALSDALAGYVAWLQDAGYSHIDVYDYPHETEEGWGSFIVWVGRADDAQDLEAHAAALRSVRIGEDHPFSSAFVTLFTD